MKFTILKVGLAYIAFIWMLNGFNLLVLLSLIGLFAIIGGIAYLFANSIGLALGLNGQAFESEHSTPFTDTHSLGSDYTNTHSLHNSLSHDIFDSDPLSHDQFSSPSINPANGLPMIDNAIDIEGNAFGTSSDMEIGLFDSHDPFDSHDSFSSFDSHDSFSSFDDPFS